MATPHPIHPHPHDEAACKRRLAELQQGLSLWDKFKIYRAIRKLFTNPIMKEKLLSRKLWITVLAAALTTLAAQLGLDPELAAKIIAGLVGTYLVGQSAVDVTKEIKADPAAKTSKAH